MLPPPNPPTRRKTSLPTSSYRPNTSISQQANSNFGTSLVDAFLGLIPQARPPSTATPVNQTTRDLYEDWGTSQAPLSLPFPPISQNVHRDGLQQGGPQIARPPHHTSHTNIAAPAARSPFPTARSSRQSPGNELVPETVEPSELVNLLESQVSQSSDPGNQHIIPSSINQSPYIQRPGSTPTGLVYRDHVPAEGNLQLQQQQNSLFTQASSTKAHTQWRPKQSLLPQTIIPETPYSESSAMAYSTPPTGGIQRPSSTSMTHHNRPTVTDTYRPPPLPTTTPSPAPGPTANTTRPTNPPRNIWIPPSTSHRSNPRSNTPVRTTSAMSNRTTPAPALTNLRNPIPSGTINRPTAAEIFIRDSAPKQTSGEKITALINETNTQMSEKMDIMLKEIRTLRDQVHEVQTSQRALATREEIIEEITTQLSTALVENLSGVNDKLDTNTRDLPGQVTKGVDEKLKLHIKDLRDDLEKLKPAKETSSSSSSEGVSEKPLTELLNHLITKLSSMDDIATFLKNNRDLPKALRDVSIFGGAMEALMKKIGGVSATTTTYNGVIARDLAPAAYEGGELSGNSKGRATGHITSPQGNISSSTSASTSGNTLADIHSTLQAILYRLDRPVLASCNPHSPGNNSIDIATILGEVKALLTSLNPSHLLQGDEHGHTREKGKGKAKRLDSGDSACSHDQAANNGSDMVVGGILNTVTILTHELIDLKNQLRLPLVTARPPLPFQQPQQSQQYQQRVQTQLHLPQKTRNGSAPIAMQLQQTQPQPLLNPSNTPKYRAYVPGDHSIKPPLSYHATTTSIAQQDRYGDGNSNGTPSAQVIGRSSYPYITPVTFGPHLPKQGPQDINRLGPSPGATRRQISDEQESQAIEATSAIKVPMTNNPTASTPKSGRAVGSTPSGQMVWRKGGFQVIPALPSIQIQSQNQTQSPRQTQPKALRPTTSVQDVFGEVRNVPPPVTWKPSAAVPTSSTIIPATTTTEPLHPILESQEATTSETYNNDNGTIIPETDLSSIPQGTSHAISVVPPKQIPAPKNVIVLEDTSSEDTSDPFAEYDIKPPAPSKPRTTSKRKATTGAPLGATTGNLWLSSKPSRAGSKGIGKGKAKTPASGTTSQAGTGKSRKVSEGPGAKKIKLEHPAATSSSTTQTRTNSSPNDVRLNDAIANGITTALSHVTRGGLRNFNAVMSPQDGNVPVASPLPVGTVGPATRARSRTKSVATAATTTASNRLSQATRVDTPQGYEATQPQSQTHPHPQNNQVQSQSNTLTQPTVNYSQLQSSQTQQSQVSQSLIPEGQGPAPPRKTYGTTPRRSLTSQRARTLMDDIYNWDSSGDSD